MGCRFANQIETPHEIVLIFMIMTILVNISLSIVLTRKVTNAFPDLGIGLPVPFFGLNFRKHFSPVTSTSSRHYFCDFS